jgi:hypothetical protein
MRRCFAPSASYSLSLRSREMVANEALLQEHSLQRHVSKKEGRCKMATDRTRGAS